jgi:hypothetical protein
MQHWPVVSLNSTEKTNYQENNSTNMIQKVFFVVRLCCSDVMQPLDISDVTCVPRLEKCGVVC